MQERPALPSEDARRILVNTAYRSVGDIGAKLASVVFFVVMARELGDEAFGVFTFGLTFALIVTTLANFGQDIVLGREVARDQTLIHRYFANTLALKLLLSIPALAVTLGAAHLLGVDAETRDVTAILGIAVVAELAMGTPFATFQAHERLEFIAVTLIVQRFATAAVGIAALLLGADLHAVAFIYLGGALLGLVVAGLLMISRVVRPRIEVEPRRWRSLMRAALAIGLAGAFGLILFRVDMVMLGLLDTDSAVGNYGAAYRLLEATLFLSWSVGSATYPMFSRLTRSTEPPVGVVYERSLKLALALTLPLAAGAGVLAGPLIELLYGSDYERAAGALVLLAPTIALYPVAYLTGNLLVGRDRQRAVAVATGFIALENVLANFVLIPWLSLDGAALGTSVSQALAAIVLVRLAGDVTGPIDWARLAAGPAIATGLAVLAMALLHDSLAAAICAGAGVYVLALAAFERVVFPEDARALAAFVRRDERQIA